MINHRKLAVLAGTAALALVPAGVAEAAGKQSSPKECTKKGQKKCPPSVPGRMTGHGHDFTTTYGKVAWEFRNMICNRNKFPDLKVSWTAPGGERMRFVLKSYTDNAGPRCLDTALDEGNPRAGFDTMYGSGTGLLNGEEASIRFVFTDEGEPGRDDSAWFVIGTADGIEFDNKAEDGGNHQAHRK